MARAMTRFMAIGDLSSAVGDSGLCFGAKIWRYSDGMVSQITSRGNQLPKRTTNAFNGVVKPSAFASDHLPVNLAELDRVHSPFLKGFVAFSAAAKLPAY
jgi:hypothetical protein